MIEQDSSPLLKTTGLKKYFKVGEGMLHAVDDINIEINKGATLGVVGESGCGKSTLGRCILRLIEPTSGEIFFDDMNVSKLSKSDMTKMRLKMQIIFQDPYASLNPRMSVIELIAEYMIVNKVYSNKREAYNRAAQLMDTIGLARRLANLFPHELDGGRRQRIGVARALSLNPSFIVCDEPVSALDVSIQAQILNLLMDLQDEMGLTYMFITHNLSVVRHISSDIMVMYLGRCVETAPTKALFSNPIHPYTRALLDAIPVPDISMRHKVLKTIKGELKSPINPPLGCLFAPRCEYALPECSNTEQKLVELEPGHFVACMKAQSLSI